MYRLTRGGGTVELVVGRDGLGERGDALQPVRARDDRPDARREALELVGGLGLLRVVGGAVEQIPLIERALELAGHLTIAGPGILERADHAAERPVSGRERLEERLPRAPNLLGIVLETGPDRDHEDDDSGHEHHDEREHGPAKSATHDVRSP